MELIRSDHAGLATKVEFLQPRQSHPHQLSLSLVLEAQATQPQGPGTKHNSRGEEGHSVAPLDLRDPGSLGDHTPGTDRCLGIPATMAMGFTQATSRTVGTGKQA